MLSAMLSHSTLLKTFNEGEFTEHARPVTGWRLLDWQSVLNLLNSNGLQPETILTEKSRREVFVRKRRTRR
jgi:hypothetical protein